METLHFVKWLQSDASEVEVCSEAVQHCSDCSPTPPESEVEVGLQWVQTLQWLLEPPEKQVEHMQHAIYWLSAWVTASTHFSKLTEKSKQIPPEYLDSGSWAAVSAVQLCSDCSLTPLWPPWPPNNQKWKLGCSECSSTLQWLQSDAPRTHVVACHLLVNVLWVTGFTHFTSWSGKSHKATNSSWDKSKHFYLDNSESG